MPRVSGATGMTPREVGRLYRVGVDRVRAWIRAGLLKAINVGATISGRPRFVVLPHHLEAFEQQRLAVPTVKRKINRRREPPPKDFFPD